MSTTESITISAATIDQLLSIREIAAQNNESKQTEESAAILRTLESTMRLIGIVWDKEETEEERDERKATFAEELEAMESKARKTGLLDVDRNMHQYRISEQHKCDCIGAGRVRMHWYLSRSDDRTPVIRVDWFFPTEAKRKVYTKSGLVTRKMTWECTNRSQKFPFTEKGFDAACALFDSLMAE